MDNESQSGSRLERKMEKTRQQIVSTAMALFKQKGIDNTTMEQIAETADIAKGTLYNYFPAKEAIIDAIMQQSFEKNNSERIDNIRSLANTHERSIYIMDLLIEGVQANLTFFERYMVYRMQMLVSFQQIKAQRSGFRQLTAEIIDLGQTNGEVRTDLPDEILIDLFEFTFIEIVKQLALQPQDFDKQKTIELYTDLFINGVKSK